MEDDYQDDQAGIFVNTGNFQHTGYFENTKCLEADEIGDEEKNGLFRNAGYFQNRGEFVNRGADQDIEIGGDGDDGRVKATAEANSHDADYGCHFENTSLFRNSTRFENTGQFQNIKPNSNTNDDDEDNNHCPDYRENRGAFENTGCFDNSGQFENTGFFRNIDNNDADTDGTPSSPDDSLPIVPEAAKDLLLVPDSAREEEGVCVRTDSVVMTGKVKITEGLLKRKRSDEQ